MRADVVDLFHGDKFASDVSRRTSLAEDLAAVQAFGIRGVFLKATQGVLSHDPAYAARRRAVDDAGLMPGAYDFNTGDPVRQQVDCFFAVAEPDIGPRGRVACCLDFEDNRASEMTLGQLCDYLELADARLGRRFWIYSGDRLKSLIVHASADQRAFLAQHILWGCEYGPRFRLVDDSGHGLPWSAESILWQFTGDGAGPGPHAIPGIATAGIDVSTWTGDLAQLAAAWSGAPLAGGPDLEPVVDHAAAPPAAAQPAQAASPFPPSPASGGGGARATQAAAPQRSQARDRNATET